MGSMLTTRWPGICIYGSVFTNLLNALIITILKDVVNTELEPK